MGPKSTKSLNVAPPGNYFWVTFSPLGNFMIVYLFSFLSSGEVGLTVPNGGARSALNAAGSLERRRLS